MQAMGSESYVIPATLSVLECGVFFKFQIPLLHYLLVTRRDWLIGVHSGALTSLRTSQVLDGFEKLERS